MITLSFRAIKSYQVAPKLTLSGCLEIYKDEYTERYLVWRMLVFCWFCKLPWKKNHKRLPDYLWKNKLKTQGMMWWGVNFAESLYYMYVLRSNCHNHALNCCILQLQDRNNYMQVKRYMYPKQRECKIIVSLNYFYNHLYQSFLSERVQSPFSLVLCYFGRSSSLIIWYLTTAGRLHKPFLLK